MEVSSFAGPLLGNIDPMRMASTVSGDRIERGAGKVPDEYGLASRGWGRIEVRQLAPARDLRCRLRNLLAIDAKPVCEISLRQGVGALICRRTQQRCCIHRLVCAARQNEVGAAEELGNAHLGCLEIDAGNLHCHVEDRVALCAGAPRSRRIGIPAPVILAAVGRIGTRDVRVALAPVDTQGVENVCLAASDRLLDLPDRREEVPTHDRELQGSIWRRLIGGG